MSLAVGLPNGVVVASCVKGQVSLSVAPLREAKAQAWSSICLPVQRMTDMLSRGHSLSVHHGLETTSAKGLWINVPAACRGFRSDEASVGHASIVRLNPQVGRRPLVTFLAGTVPPAGVSTYYRTEYSVHRLCLSAVTILGIYLDYVALMRKQ